MNSTTSPDLEMMAKAYFSDKIAITLGSQFMGYVLSFSPLYPPSILPLILSHCIPQNPVESY
jgi:hypothetical protein